MKKQNKNKWDLSKTLKQLKEGPLPNDFDGWDLRYGEKDLSISFLAAILGRLPDQCGEHWYSKGRTGLLLVEAHMMAHQKLPTEEIDWTRAGRSGAPIVFTAIKYAGLPKNFDHWHLKNNRGESVIEYAKRVGRLH